VAKSLLEGPSENGPKYVARTVDAPPFFPRYFHLKIGMLAISAYARIAGLLLLATGAVGLALFGWYQSAIFYHAGLGLFFLLVGLSRLEGTYIRQIVGGFGVFLVAIGGTTILATWLSPMRYLHGPIETTSLVVGVASILAARHLPDRRGLKRDRRAS
jgi:hypothetical protein